MTLMTSVLSLGNNSTTGPHGTAGNSRNDMNVSVSSKEGRMSLGSSAKVSAKVTNTRMWSHFTSFYYLPSRKESSWKDEIN